MSFIRFAQALALIVMLATAPAAFARTENTDFAVSYSTGWSFDTSRSWSGGSAHSSRTPGAQAVLTFTATSVTWIGARMPSTGIARVYIDGVLRATVDTYGAASEEIRVPMFTVNDLSNAAHTMTIEATGQKNPAASDSIIYVDAFDAPAVTISRLQETDSAVAYVGTWTQFDQTRAWSEGKAAWSTTPGSQASFAFNGIGITWVSSRLPTTGIASLYLDGVHVADVDTYSPSPQIQQALYTLESLADGPHTLMIQVLGTRNPQSTGTTIYIDAFDVSIAGKRYQDWDSQVVFAPSGNNWAFNTNDHAYNEGTVAETIVGGSSATFSFSGTGVAFVSGTCPRCGIAQVSLDNGPASTIDLYAIGDAPQKTVYTATGLTPGAHTLKITATGQKNPASQYYWVVVDAFDVFSGSGGGASAPVLQSAVSRKTHGAAGAFDLTLSLLASNPTTEPRASGSGGSHTIVFKFDKLITGGTASVTAGTATAGAPTFSGNEMRVPLTNVADVQYVTVAVTNVVAADGGSGGIGSVRIGFLGGDVNGNRSVTVSDTLFASASSGQPVNSATFLRDVNLTGTLNLSDAQFIEARLTHTLPPP